MQAFGISLVMAGVILAVFGVRASESLSSNVPGALIGAPPKRSIAILATGIGAAVVGLFLAFLGARSS